jgi:hypothetical protein
MTDIDIEAVRRRCWHYLSPEVAAHAGISLARLQAFVAGSFSALGSGAAELREQELLALARRVGCCDER